jgi:hypothetical protein
MKSKDHVAKHYLQGAAFNSNDVPLMPFPELILVRGGSQAYLWLGWKGGCLGTLHGQAKLRKLALAILKEIPPTVTEARAISKNSKGARKK